jgi:hypothetical protein
MNVWRLDSQDLTQSTAAQLGERLYDRYRIGATKDATLTMDGHSLAIAELSLGGMSIVVPRDFANRLLVSERMSGQLSLNHKLMEVSFDVLIQKKALAQTVEIGCRWTYDEPELLDVLRPVIQLLDLGHQAHQQLPVEYPESASTDVAAFDHIDYDLELCLDDRAFTLIFTDDQTQLAVQSSIDGNIATWVNVGQGGERCRFRPVRGHFCADKARWVLRGFASTAPAIARFLEHR